MCGVKSGEVYCDVPLVSVYRGFTSREWRKFIYAKEAAKRRWTTEVELESGLCSGSDCVLKHSVL